MKKTAIFIIAFLLVSTLAFADSKIVYREIDGEILLAMDAEKAGTFKVEGRRVYSVDQWGNESLRVSVNNEKEVLKTMEISAEETPDELLEKPGKYKVKDGKVELKEAE